MALIRLTGFWSHFDALINGFLFYWIHFVWGGSQVKFLRLRLAYAFLLESFGIGVGLLKILRFSLELGHSLKLLVLARRFFFCAFWEVLWVFTWCFWFIKVAEGRALCLALATLDEVWSDWVRDWLVDTFRHTIFSYLDSCIRFLKTWCKLNNLLGLADFFNIRRSTVLEAATIFDDFLGHLEPSVDLCFYVHIERPLHQFVSVFLLINDKPVHKSLLNCFLFFLHQCSGDLAFLFKILRLRVLNLPLSEFLGLSNGFASTIGVMRVFLNLVWLDCALSLSLWWQPNFVGECLPIRV